MQGKLKDFPDEFLASEFSYFFFRMPWQTTNRLAKDKYSHEGRDGGNTALQGGRLEKKIMRSKIDFPAALCRQRDERTIAEDLKPPSLFGCFLSRLQFINLVFHIHILFPAF